MVVIEIDPNPNCEPMDQRVFHNAEEARPVLRVCVGRDNAAPAWWDVTGWTVAGAPCPALGCRVDDSGDGLAVLIFGGDAGLRLRPKGSAGPWSLKDPAQWGSPLLILGSDGADVQFAEQKAA